MLDTVKLRSPVIPEDLAAAVEASLVLRTAVDLATGQLLYELCSGGLEGSYDHRVSVMVQRERWISERLPISRRVYTRKEASPPYLELEGSVHKAMLGHNVAGGPCDLRAACRWFVADVADRLGVRLPPADLWEARRLDWAEVYDLGSFEACEEFVRALQAAAFPRRKVARWGAESVGSAGTTTGVVAYHKGPEFAAHDARRYRRAGHDVLALELQQRANRLLRVEVRAKARKLDEDHGQAPAVAELTEEYLRRIHDWETARLLREGKADMETVRRAEEVRERLAAEYGERLAATLYATWVWFSTLGEQQARKRMKRATFYLHRKQLQAAGVSWHGTDVAIVQRFTLIPAGFSPVRTDPRRLTGEDPRVVQLLAPYREQAAD
jgi:II/X family phage/plasmid replication protein